MSVKMKNPRMTGFVLLLSAFMCAADTMTLQPIIDLLATEVFPEYGYGTVSMIMTVSALALAIISIATGFLSRAGKKRLLIIGSILFTGGGLAGILITNIYYIIFTRLIEGIGAGLVLTVSMILIPTLFQEQKEVDRLMGLNGVMTSLFAAIITFTSGYMAMVNWKLPFLYYAFGAVILILQILYIPNDKGTASTDAPASGGFHITKRGWVHVLDVFVYGVITSFFFVCISGVVAENGIGNAAQAGTIVTFNTIGSFLIGFAFAKIFSTLKRFTAPVLYIVMAIAVFAITQVTTVPMACAVAFLHGVGYNSYFSYFLAKVPMVSNEKTMDSTMSMCNGIYYLGQFCTPFLMNLVASVTGNSSTVFAMHFELVCLIILIVVHLICAFVGNAHEKVSA